MGMFSPQKYIEIIRSIDNNGYDFISFDRMLVIYANLTSPWDTFHSQLYFDSLLKHNLKNTNVHGNNQKQTMYD